MRRPMRALALLVVLAAGCGSSGTDAQLAVVDAAERTSEVGTARLAMTVEHDASPDMTMTMEGVADFDADLVEMRMEVPGMPVEGGDGITTITDGTVVYTQVPTPDGPPQWYRLDAAEMPGMPADAMGGTGGAQNPADSLDYLRGIADDVTEAGTEEVRGTETTRYDGTIDLERAVEESPEEQRDLMRRNIEMLGTSEMPVSVWVDDDGLLRRMTYEMDLSQAQPPEGAGEQAPLGRMTITMEMFDFGLDVDITPPPEDEVTDFDDLGVPPPGPDS